MPDFFEDKNYNEYFEKLNSRIGAPDNKTISKKSSPVKQKKGFYRVIKIRRGGIAICLILSILCVVVLSVKSCGDDKKQTPTPQNSVTQQNKDDVVKPEKINFKEDENTVEIPESNDAKTAVVVRLKDKKIVAERGAHERIYPASTVKIMTLLTAVEHIKGLDDTFTMSYEITDPLFVEDASVAGFLNGEKVTMKDLLYGMILPSGADSAMGLAVKIAGSEEAFVGLMNEKAKALGLKNTHFTNVSGLHSEENYSTSYDMAIILYHAMQNSLCREVLSTYQYTTEKTPQNPDGILLSSTLFSYMYGDEPETATVQGGKTGYVYESGYCIASFGEANDSKNEYVVVTMGNSSKWPAFYGQIDLYKEFAK